MIKKLLPLLLIALVAAGGFFIFKALRHNRSPRLDHYGVYKFKKLKDGIVAKAGTLEVTGQQVLDPAYVDMVERKNAMLATMAYEQILAKKDFRSATFAGAPPSRPFEEYCSIYGVKCDNAKSVSFDPKQKPYLIVDGKKYDRDAVDTENLHYQALKTEIFDHLLANIRGEIRRRVLYDVAMADKTSVEDFLEKEIISNQEVEAQAKQNIADKYRDTGGLNETDRKNFEKSEQDHVRNDAIDRYLEKNFLKLPIEVNVELPDFTFEMKWDWVAHIGDSKSPVRVIFISDYKSAAGRDVIAHIPEYAAKFPRAVFGHRPFFDRSDRYQVMIGEMALCVWQSHSNKYWEFLNQVGALDQKNFEKDMNAVLDGLEINTPDVKSCFLSRKYKDALEYHLKWGEHFKILSGPVSIVGREVYIGPMDTRLLGEILSRQ